MIGSQKIVTFCFSPTGTSRKNMMAVVSGMTPIEYKHIDFTYKTPEDGLMVSREDVAIFSVPVYGGKVAPIALQRMDKVKGNMTPAVLIVTYGNRNFEQALVQLEEFVSARGFLPIAGAALIGEHSYSNAQYPIAIGRPDTKDLDSARKFGEKVMNKIQTGEISCKHSIDIAKNMSALETPETALLAFRTFIQEYTRQQQENPMKVYPSATAEVCSHCGMCVDVCPTQAIIIGHEEVTDTSRCIRCCACVKGCPSGARTFVSPFARPLFENFQMRREPLYIF
ncbi:MAG: 4Fe-4S binding protein [Bacteroidaceae bacterium]|nr:4Fe-4S binding protein [Bacteroidaceae bacterium]